MLSTTKLLRGAKHHLCIDFHPRRSASFFPTTNDPADLGRRWRALVQAFVTQANFDGEVAPPVVNVPLPRGALHHVCIDFQPDDRAVFHFATCDDDAQAAVRRFFRIVTALAEQPTAIRCAAGDHPR